MYLILFNLYIECALKNWKLHCNKMGIPVGDETLFLLNFEDDQVVAAPDVYDLESTGFTGESQKKN